MNTSRRVVLALAIVLIPTLLPGEQTQGADTEKGSFHGLEYRLIGPAAGGRVSRVAGVVGDDLIYYAATAAGGVWKSVNGGSKWESIFDDQPISSIGSIAVAPSDPNVVWVGSGEANIRGNVAEGNGIYRSTDAGETWKHVWSAEGQIGTMAVHPGDPDVAFAAVLGSPFGPGPERGVFRTTDGGETWQKVLYEDPDTGASDVCFHPSNPRILFAGLWQTRRFPWGLTSGGSGSGLYVSRDGGDTWKKLEGRGLPGGIWGRVGVRVAASEPNRVYALIEAEEGGLFRSDNGGKNWTRISASRGIRQRAWYYTTLTIDPTNADVIWFPQVGMLKTDDGGKTIRMVKGGGWDYHDVWIDPDNPRRMVVGSDAGISLSRDAGETWLRPPLPISQFYHLSVDTKPAIPRAREPAGPRYGLRTQQQPPWRRDPLLGLVLGRGRRSRPRGGRPVGPEHRVGRRVPGLHLAIRPTDRSGTTRRDLSLQRVGPCRSRPPLPLSVDSADRDLSPRPEGRVPRRQCALQDRGPRSELAGDQPRPDPQRSDEAGVGRRTNYR